MAATSTFHPTSHFSPPSHAASPNMVIDSVRNRSPMLSPAPPRSEEKSGDSGGQNTPTRHDFGGIPGQRALPDTPFSPASIATTPGADKSDAGDDDGSRPGSALNQNDSEDVEMADDDDQDDESDNDSTTSDPQRPRKKKKGQRFFCTDFPPCNLSFTRSEHLARHIRKHTGERPFQCHCSRRFSRLDNLRQHAQTVHVNEEIPGDSLAATGTRFQRQIRTDRVRAPGPRSRAGTGGSISGHVRGHSRNLSSSSIASTASNISAVPDDGRRRPPPLAMAHDMSRGGLVIDTYGAPAPVTQYAYYPQQSSSGYSTPTSATFSTGGNSPRFPMQSPTMASRPYYPLPPRSARRLSVPANVSPYGAAPGSATYPGPYFSPPHGHASTASTSSIASPSSSIYSHSRRESEAELEWRRRTWHSGTYAAQMQMQRPATSGLMYQQTPDEPRPTTSGLSAASQVTRLPGIESFDHAANAPRLPSPMEIDRSARAPAYPGPAEVRPSAPTHRASQSAWESSLHQGLTRLDIANSTPPRAPPVTHQRAPLPAFSFPQAPPPADGPRDAPPPASAEHLSAANRRQGWYGGPTTASLSQPINIARRRSQDDSVSSEGVPTPSTSQGHEAHPAIVHGSGRVESRPAGAYASSEHAHAMQAREGSKPEPTRNDSGSIIYNAYSAPAQTAPYALQSGYGDRSAGHSPAPQSNDMGRLEALVAVATSESAHR